MFQKLTFLGLLFMVFTIGTVLLTSGYNKKHDQPVTALQSPEIGQKTTDSLYLVKILQGPSKGIVMMKAFGIGDMNNDNYSDFVVLRMYDTFSLVEIYLGNRNFDVSPSFSIASKYVQPVGDVNGDGYDDLVICDSSLAPLAYSKFFILYGGEVIDTIPHFFYIAPENMGPYGINHDRIGDINGDGFDDIAISVLNVFYGVSKIAIFYGGSIIHSVPDVTINNFIQYDTFGWCTTGIGDINRDGFDDLLIAAPDVKPNTDTGRVYLFHGGNTFDPKPAYVWKGSTSMGFGYDVFNLKDINKDGKNEFSIYGSRRIYFSPDSTLPIKGKTIGAGGDINGDGFDDFIMGDINYLNNQGVMVGNVCGFYGSSTLDTTPDFTMEGKVKWGNFGSYQNILGDFNNDGYDDVLVGEPNFYTSVAYNADSAVGRVYVYSYKKITSVFTNNVESDKNFTICNYPNPFNPSTVISYQIPAYSKVTIKIFNSLGKEIVTLLEAEKQAGEYKIIFNADKLASGVYIYSIKAAPINGSINAATKSGKMILLR